MGWKSLKPEDNKIIIGLKHPIRYSDSIKSIIFNYGQCEVLVPLKKQGIVLGSIKSCMEVWKDVKKFLDHANRKIIIEEEDGEYKRFVVE